VVFSRSQFKFEPHPNKTTLECRTDLLEEEQQASQGEQVYELQDNEKITIKLFKETLNLLYKFTFYSAKDEFPDSY